MSYWTFPVFRRRGLATRAVVLVTRYAFDTLGVTEIELARPLQNSGLEHPPLRMLAPSVA